jgi:hypothetical protein
MFGSPRPEQQVTPALSPRFGLRRRFRRNPARFRHLLYELLEDRRLLSGGHPPMVLPGMHLVDSAISQGHRIKNRAVSGVSVSYACKVAPHWAC